VRSSTGTGLKRKRKERLKIIGGQEKLPYGKPTLGGEGFNDYWAPVGAVKKPWK